MVYTKVGSFAREPLVTEDALGQKVIHGGGAVRTGKDGALHPAYDLIQGDIGKTMARWANDRGSVTDLDRKQLAQWYRNKGLYKGNTDKELDDFLYGRAVAMSQGLPSVSALERSTSGDSLKNAAKRMTGGGIRIN